MAERRTYTKEEREAVLADVPALVLDARRRSLHNSGRGRPVPVYEYVCRRCSQAFEELVFTGDAPPVCPACHAPDAERVLSVVAVGRADAGEPTRAVGPCGSCGDPRGPGACRLN